MLFFSLVILILVMEMSTATPLVDEEKIIFFYTQNRTTPEEFFSPSCSLSSFRFLSEVKVYRLQDEEKQELILCCPAT